MKKITALISLINLAIKFTGRSGALAAIGRLGRPGAGLLHPRVFTGRVNKPLMLAALVSAAVLSLSGCNTVQGMGRDIERGGQAIEKAAK